MTDKIQDNQIKSSVAEAKPDRTTEKELQMSVISSIAPKNIEYCNTDLNINFLKNRQR